MVINHHALILKGKSGEKTFRKIYNGPHIPFERLKEESKAIKKKWKAEEKDRKI